MIHLVNKYLLTKFLCLLHDGKMWLQNRILKNNFWIGIERPTISLGPKHTNHVTLGNSNF